ncbi:MAG: beta-ketoacyl synthase N-terminal-like domain-containing protein [Planctomycetota bacterium]
MPPSPTDNPPPLQIAGLGLITPLGRSAWETLAALLDGRTLADRIPQLPDHAADVDFARALGCVATAQQDPVDPAIALAEAAAREAATMAGVSLDHLPTWIASSKGCVAAATPNALRPLLVRPTDPPTDPATDQPVPPGDPRAWLHRPGLAEALALGPHATLTHHLAQRTGIAPVAHHVAACASSLVALHHAANHLRRLPEPAPGQSISALVVTAEASLLPAFIASYQRLGVLAPLTRDGYRQTPLAQKRQGFMLAETAAALILTRRSTTPQRPQAEAERSAAPGTSPTPSQPSNPKPQTSSPQLTLLDTAITTEAHDLIRPAPDMPALRRLAANLFAGRPIDCLHPHAPGTPDHDPAELQALADVLNAEREMTQAHDPVHVYACKGALGHALGASGLAALVLAALCLTAGKRPPMPWLANTPRMTPCPVPIPADTQPIPRTGTHAIFASGFAGHTAGALIQRT